MRIRSAALLLALVVLGVSAAAAPAAGPSAPLRGAGRLSAKPPVALPAMPSSPAPGANAALPRTGTEVWPLAVTGSLLLLAGLGAQMAARRRRL